MIDGSEILRKKVLISTVEIVSSSSEDIVGTFSLDFGRSSEEWAGTFSEPDPY
jgi:hypothetical protein